MAEPSFGERLGRESEAWVSEGLITVEQAAALRARYAAEPPGTAARGRAAAALALVGALAVGFGVIGFLAANWDAIPHGARLALITLAIAAAYAGAYELRDRSHRLPRVGVALYLLGVILYGAALFLVGQMYHVEAHDPLALLLWAAGATAVALAVRARPLGWAAVAIFTGWVGWEGGTALDGSGESGTALAALAVVYGAALYGAGTVVRERGLPPWLAGTGLAGAARRIGLVVVAAGLLPLTFREATRELVDAGRSLDTTLQVALVALALLAFVAAAAVAVARRRSGGIEAAVLAAAVAVLLAGVLVGGGDVVYAILFNLLFAALALAAIYAGYLTDEPWLVNVGVALVAIDIVVRYFDVFWDALPRSAGLIGAGLVVLALAFLLERGRKHVLAEMAE